MHRPSVRVGGYGDGLERPHIGDAVQVNVGLGGFDPSILLLIIPLAIVQLTLLILAVVDLLRDDRRVRGGNKGVWAVIIVFVNLIGPILYFLLGREEGPPPDAEPGPATAPGWGSRRDPPIVVGPGAGQAAPSARRDAAPTPAPSLLALQRPAGEPIPRDAPSAIRIEGLTKRYPGGVLALD